jgi:peptidyl-prolyl cis-trans isomerase D
MLSTFRSHAKGWIAWAFVILVSVPFALWGVGQYRSLVTTDYVAKVNGDKIMPNQLQQAYQQAFQQHQAQSGGKYDPTQAEQTQLKMQTLQKLIDTQLLLQQAGKDQLVASGADVRAQINQIPAFQLNGHFNYQQYKLVLANNRLTVPQFESQVRGDIVVGQLQRGLAGSAFPTPREVRDLAALAQQQRKMAWFVLPVKDFKPAQPPSEEAIAGYYKSHQEQYSIPETLTIAYLRLDKKTLEERIDAKPEELQDYYRTHQAQYGIPPARKVAEILVKPSAQGTAAVAAAKSRIEKLLQQVKQSKDSQKTFAALARKDSDDPVSSRNGGSMGYVSRGQLPQELDDALFNLPKTGDLAGPIRTPRGWVILQLLDKRAGSVKPYAQVKGQVARDYKADKAKSLYYKLDGQFANLTYENSGSLDAAAKALGLKIQTVSGVTEDQGTGIAANELVRKAAFSDSVLKQRQNSNPIKLGNEDAVVLRVSNVTPSKVKPLSVVRDDVVSALMGKQAREAAAKAASGALSDLRGGARIAAVASQLGVKLQGPTRVKRTDTKLPQILSQSLFMLAPAAGGNPRYASVELPDGSQAVYALLGVEQGNVKDLPKMQQTAYMQELARIYALETRQSYLAWLHSQADIKIVKDNIQ